MADSIINTPNPGAEQSWGSVPYSNWSTAEVADQWDNAFAYLNDLQIGASFSTTDAAVWGLGLNKSNTLSFSDTPPAFALIKKVMESLFTAETYVDYIGFTRNISETLTLVENIKKVPSKLYFTLLYVTSTSHRNVFKNPSDSLNVSDTFSRTLSFLREYQEALNVLEVGSRGSTHNSSESLSMSEFYAKQLHQYNSVDLQVLEDINTVTVFILNYLESLNLEGVAANNINLFKTSTLSVEDGLNRKGNSVFSEISLFAKGMTITEFKDLVDSGSPAGYQQFQKFLPGDYTYRYAKVKAVLETLSDDTPVVDNLKIVVDVPDIHNKGTAVITNAATGAAVTYYRAYTVSSPDIVVAFKGGTGGVASPEISAETLTGFTVKLINNSGTYITGSVTWASDGY